MFSVHALSRALAVAGAAAVLTTPAFAQIAVSANDGKPLLVNGKVTILKDPPPDTATIIDLKTFPPKVIGEVADVPTSVVGPPSGVAITPDEGIAFSADGQYILVQNMVEKNLMVFRFADGKLTDTGHKIDVKGGPAGIRTAAK